MTDAVTDLLRTGAQRLIAEAIESELAVVLGQFEHRRVRDGKARWNETATNQSEICKQTLAQCQ